MKKTILIATFLFLLILFTSVFFVYNKNNDDMLFSDYLVKVNVQIEKLGNEISKLDSKKTALDYEDIYSLRKNVAYLTEYLEITNKVNLESIEIAKSYLNKFTDEKYIAPINNDILFYQETIKNTNDIENSFIDRYNFLIDNHNQYKLIDNKITFTDNVLSQQLTVLNDNIKEKMKIADEQKKNFEKFKENKNIY